MRRRGLGRASTIVVVLSLAALLLSSGLIGTTDGLFNGETQNAGSTFAGGWVGAASSPTTTAKGYDIALGWTVGTHGPVTGQQLNGASNATTASCNGVVYTSIATLASASTNTYTDASRGTATNNGDWFCYQLVSTSATAWTAAAAVPPVQLGLVANGLSMANLATAGLIEKNDTITITFNQKTNLPSSNIKVCVWATGSIVVGDTTSGCTNSTDAFSVGKITLTGATIASNLAFTASTVTLSTAAPWTMTIKLAGSNSTSTVTGSPTWLLTPASTILSSITVHQATICSAAKTTCQPSSTSNF